MSSLINSKVIISLIQEMDQKTLNFREFLSIFAYKGQLANQAWPGQIWLGQH
jgi:hypothetical protein